MIKKKFFKSFAALAVVAMLVGCSTYHAPGGKRLSDPHFCKSDMGDALCMLGIGAAVVGAAVLVVQ